MDSTIVKRKAERLMIDGALKKVRMRKGSRLDDYDPYARDGLSKLEDVQMEIKDDLRMKWRERNESIPSADSNYLEEPNYAQSVEACKCESHATCNCYFVNDNIYMRLYCVHENRR